MLSYYLQQLRICPNKYKPLLNQILNTSVITKIQDVRAGVWINKTLQAESTAKSSFTRSFCSGESRKILLWLLHPWTSPWLAPASASILVLCCFLKSSFSQGIYIVSLVWTSHLAAGVQKEFHSEVTQGSLVIPRFKQCYFKEFKERKRTKLFHNRNGCLVPRDLRAVRKRNSVATPWRTS